MLSSIGMIDGRPGSSIAGLSKIRPILIKTLTPEETSSTELIDFG